MDSQLRLQGKSAVVTGAGGGIGRATSLELAAAGARLLLVDTDADQLQQSASAVRGEGGTAEVAICDVSVAEQVRETVSEACRYLGRIDILFNNAGIGGIISGLTDYPEDVFDRVIAVNLKGVFLWLKYVLPHMVGNAGGVVINTASVSGLVGYPSEGAYGASKHGVVGLTKIAAAEVGRFGVRVNAVCPGPIDTPMLRTWEEAAEALSGAGTGLQSIVSTVPMGRRGTAAEVAAVVAFLASDAASFVNGALWTVDGGEYTSA